MTSGKVRESFGRVVADCCQSQPLVAEFIDTALQLDQLRLAEGSPVC
jgi:hypothetical protein